MNLAARLEAENKTFGTSICLSEDVRVEDDRIVYREIGDVSVRGITMPVRVYEAQRATRIPADRLQAYRDAFALLKESPERAAEKFQALLDAAPDDGLVAYQISRTRTGLSGA